MNDWVSLHRHNGVIWYSRETVDELLAAISELMDYTRAGTFHADEGEEDAFYRALAVYKRYTLRAVATGQLAPLIQTTDFTSGTVPEWGLEP